MNSTLPDGRVPEIDSAEIAENPAISKPSPQHGIHSDLSSHPLCVELTLSARYYLPSDVSSLASLVAWEYFRALCVGGTPNSDPLFQYQRGQSLRWKSPLLGPVFRAPIPPTGGIGSRSTKTVVRVSHGIGSVVIISVTHRFRKNFGFFSTGV